MDPRRKSQGPFRVLAGVRLSAVRVQFAVSGIELHLPNGSQLEPSVVVAGPWPPGARTIIRPGDLVRREGLKFTDWHPVAGGECADFVGADGGLEQLCIHLYPVGDFGSPRR